MPTAVWAPTTRAHWEAAATGDVAAGADGAAGAGMGQAQESEERARASESEWESESSSLSRWRWPGLGREVTKPAHYPGRAMARVPAQSSRVLGSRAEGAMGRRLARMMRGSGSS